MGAKQNNESPNGTFKCTHFDARIEQPEFRVYSIVATIPRSLSLTQMKSNRRTTQFYKDMSAPVCKLALLAVAINVPSRAVSAISHPLRNAP